MLHKDYLLKQLHQLLDELKQRIATFKISETEDISLSYAGLYKDYFKQDRNYFLENDYDTISEHLDKNEQYLTALSELMFMESEDNIKIRRELLSKSLYILAFLDQKSTVFSQERKNKIQNLTFKIGKRET